MTYILDTCVRVLCELFESVMSFLLYIQNSTFFFFLLSLILCLNVTNLGRFDNATMIDYYQIEFKLWMRGGCVLAIT